MVTISREEKNVAGKTIYAYLSEEGYDTSRDVVVNNFTDHSPGSARKYPDPER